MKEADFEQRRAAAWDEFDRLLTAVEKRSAATGSHELPRRFREVCADLALATHRMYRGATVHRLNTLVIRGYKLLYRRRKHAAEGFLRFVADTFPAAVRADGRLFWLCSAMFWLPFFLMLGMAWIDLDWIQAILGPQGMAEMETMYGKDSDSLADMRAEFGSNFAMFGHYIRNNIGIDFRIFAGGMVAGIGTMFYLVYNGLAIGAAAGYVSYAGNPASFWSFVSGHSSFELIGMVIAGVAGMKLGLAILRPGRMTRGKAIGEAAKGALPLILGAAGMTAIAALIEGFWSAQDFPHGLKYAFGGTMWALHVAYFALLGRRPG